MIFVSDSKLAMARDQKSCGYIKINYIKICHYNKSLFKNKKNIKIYTFWWEEAYKCIMDNKSTNLIQNYQRMLAVHEIKFQVHITSQDGNIWL